MTRINVPADMLTIQYDIDGASIWEALASIVQDLPVDDDLMIRAARFAGYAPSGCPILEVQFGNLDAAKGFTAVYLDCPDADDDEVFEYLGIAKPVPA